MGPGVSSGLAFAFPPPQPFGLGPVVPGTPPPAPPSAGSAAGQPGGQFVLPFDPTEKASLPFELPGGPGPFSPDAPPSGMEGMGPPTPTVPEDTSSPSSEGGQEEEFLPTLPVKRSKKLASLPVEEEVQPKQMHIPCPWGHPLEITSEMLGKTAECPLCGKRFRLRYEDSLEFRRRRAKLQEKQDAKSGQIWLAWAILAAVVILGLLVAMTMLMR